MERLAHQVELTADEFADLVQHIDDQEQGRALMTRMTAFPPSERQALELVDIGGLSRPEAATALGISTAALRLRLFRARKRLRDETGQ